MSPIFCILNVITEQNLIKGSANIPQSHNSSLSQSGKSLATWNLLENYNICIKQRKLTKRVQKTSRVKCKTHRSLL